jgi:hypothetical protein
VGRRRGHDRDGSSAALIVRALRFAALAAIVGCGSPSARPEPTPARLPPPGPSPARAPSQVEAAPDAVEDEPLPKYVSPPDAPYRQPAGTSTPAHVPGPTPEDEKECKARGGKIQSVCMMGSLECVVRHRDGGKRCADKSECTGDCIYEGPQPAPARGAGVCQRTSDPCGCRARVIGGNIQPTMCVD